MRPRNRAGGGDHGKLGLLLALVEVHPHTPRTMIQDIALASLSGWESFYVITGSAAAALTGLQFVVIALVRDTRRRSTLSIVDTFSTPTIVHFCAVLLVSAALSAPWHVLSSAAYLLGACGLAGIVYAALVTRRTWRQTSYEPVLEDWVWHAALPLVAYTVMFIAALELSRHEADALFMTGAAVLLLLFIGIHNAWDAVTYLVVESPEAKE